MLLSSLYGIIDEVHQSFTPGRCAGADDWIADTIGAAVGAALCLLLSKKLFPRKAQN